MSLLKVTELERLIVKLALLLTAPVPKVPVVLALPICKVPALMVVTPL